MKKLIYSKEDLDLILSLENENKDKEIERLKGALQTHEILLKSNTSEIERLNTDKEQLNSLVNFNQKEIRRLNNIINELEKTLLEWHEYWEYDDSYSWQYKNVYDYIQELKGSVSNE